MTKRLNPDHIAQILHTLSDAPEGHSYTYHKDEKPDLALTSEDIKRKTPSINNSERTRLIEILRFNRMIYEAGGRAMRKYKPLAEEHPGGRIIWKWSLDEEGQKYLYYYDVFSQALSRVHIPGTVPEELDWRIIPDSIRPPKGAPLRKTKQTPLRSE